MKKTVLNPVLVFFAVLIYQPANAQTLNEMLVNEDPATLVEQARKSGGIVRGAILFHQGNINCAKCHRPIAEIDRIGPDLSRVGQEISDVAIVESILLPSKAIKKGYETTTVLTGQGQVISGVIVSQDDRKIVIRNSQNVDQLVTIERTDIERMQPGTKSSMPEGLVNQLKNRQQFLDLLHYVLDLKQRGPVTDSPIGNALARRELSNELNGLVLINKLNCTACHESKSAAVALGAKSPDAKRTPDLIWSAKWLNPVHLAEFIADPHRTKPGSSMPNLMPHLSEAVRLESAQAIVQYLVSIQGNSFPTTPEGEVDVAAVKNGNELFQTVGCVACHSPRNELAVEQPLDDSIPLGDLTGKYDVKALATFLENPHDARPSGRMPNMQLTHHEAADVSSFLLQGRRQKADRSPSNWKTDLALAERGKQFFTEFRCDQCHSSITKTVPKKPNLPSLAQLNPNRGCLSGKRGAWPDFQLNDHDQQHIQAALKNSGTALTDQQQVDLSLAFFNCTACHSRDNLGGVTAARSSHFQTTNLNLGEQGRIPPSLSGVGAKLNAKWMRDVLVNHRTIRPYMKTRMPQYGEQNIGYLIELFQSQDRLRSTEFASFDDQKEMRKLGLEIAGSRGLNCIACHTYQYQLSDTMPAVDLTEMAERLKKDWFVQYMLAPQKFSPNTVMPSYWPNGKSIRPDIAGDPKYQVEALWQYLIDGRQANAPQGVVREPLEIRVDREARMLRRSYEGIGKRGIGVGYPGGMNIAFDAEQMRLAMIWKGKFVDPSGVWNGQGHGLVRALGPVVNFRKGPELDDLLKPWEVDTGRPPTHRFKGYVLDEARRPTFRYAFESIEIDDSFAELNRTESGQVNLRRRISMTSTQNRDGVRFRLAAGPEITAASGREFLVGKQLTIRIVSDHTAKIIADSGESMLLIPLEFKVGQGHELVLEYLW